MIYNCENCSFVFSDQWLGKCCPQCNHVQGVSRIPHTSSGQVKRVVERSREAAEKAINSVYILKVPNPGSLQQKGVYHEVFRSKTIYSPL